MTQDALFVSIRYRYVKILKYFVSYGTERRRLLLHGRPFESIISVGKDVRQMWLQKSIRENEIQEVIK